MRIGHRPALDADQRLAEALRRLAGAAAADRGEQLVEPGQAVEYGQELVVIEPADDTGPAGGSGASGASGGRATRPGREA